MPLTEVYGQNCCWSMVHEGGQGTHEISGVLSRGTRHFDWEFRQWYGVRSLDIMTMDNLGSFAHGTEDLFPETASCLGKSHGRLKNGSHNPPPPPTCNPCKNHRVPLPRIPGHGKLGFTLFPTIMLPGHGTPSRMGPAQHVWPSFSLALSQLFKRWFPPPPPRKNKQTQAQAAELAVPSWRQILPGSSDSPQPCFSMMWKHVGQFVSPKL